MKKLAILHCGLALLACSIGSGRAFQEYPSLEIAPYVGFVLYDAEIKDYQSNLAFGVRVDLRTMAALGFQFHYTVSTNQDDFPNQPFGQDSYVERIHLNLTRDLLLVNGIFISGFAGVGSFNRHLPDIYDNDFSLQAGLGARRNLFEKLYLRLDAGWTGAFLEDHQAGQFTESTLTHHFDVALTLSILFDN